MTTPGKRWLRRISIGVGAIALLLMIGPMISYKTVDYSVCQVTGSTKTQITWFGHFSHDERTVSPLEQWLQRRVPAFQPRWQHLSTHTDYVVGRAFRCGIAPEVYRLKPVQNLMVEKLSEERIAKLVNVLRTGSREEQRQMVQTVANEVLSVE